MIIPLHIADSRVVTEFLRQSNTNPGLPSQIDMLRLWEVAGSTPRLHPGTWSKTLAFHLQNALKSEEWAGRADAILVPGRIGFLYALDLDEQLDEVFWGEYRPTYRNTRLQAMIAHPTPLIAMLTLGDLMMGTSGLTPAQAVESVIEGIRELTGMPRR